MEEAIRCSKVTPEGSCQLTSALVSKMLASVLDDDCFVVLCRFSYGFRLFVKEGDVARVAPGLFDSALHVDFPFDCKAVLKVARARVRLNCSTSSSK